MLIITDKGPTIFDLPARTRDLAREWADIDLKRRHTAYHEAAHAVVAYYFGWCVNPEGVEIDQRQYCGLRRRQYRNTEEAEVCINLVGWLAEVCLSPNLARCHDDDELQFHIDEARNNPDEAEADESAAFLRLLVERPELSDEDLITLYRHYEVQTLSILRRQDVWVSIERVASALLEHGKLEAGEVVDAIEGSVFSGYCSIAPDATLSTSVNDPAAARTV